MDDYKVKIHFNDQGNTLEEIIKETKNECTSN